MKLLYITHKINEDDDVFAFTSLWVQEFIKQGFDTTVICFEKGTHTGDFTVYSCGKEQGKHKVQSVTEFWRLITTLEYDRVFAHMNPKFLMAGAWYWQLKGIPVYLWYTHPAMNAPLRMSPWLCKRMFTATPTSMAEFDGNPKKVVIGHGIDMDFWDIDLKAAHERKPRHNLLSVHRISKTKRIHATVEALARLPEKYTLTIFGNVKEPEYFAELQSIIQKHNLQNRVKFCSAVRMDELKEIYNNYKIMLNFAEGTIDKTMLEAMAGGCNTITTSENAQAIGLSSWPENLEPETLAQYILNLELQSPEAMRAIVQQKHSLPALVEHMDRYIKDGS